MMRNESVMDHINQANNLNWPYITDQRYSILIIGGTEKGKRYVLINLLKHQRPDVGKIYLFIEDPFEWKYQLFFNGREKLGSKE